MMPRSGCSASRTGRSRRYSDLDLAIDAGRPVTLDELAQLAEAFRESDLPYKVDIVDWRSIDDRFRQMIAAERVRLNEAASAAGAADPGANRRATGDRYD